VLFVITGGAGFVGSNLTERLLREGHKVKIIDDLSRPGGKVVENLNYLQNKFSDKIKSKEFEFAQRSVTDLEALKTHFKNADVICHLAAQTAMTTSMSNPVEDFNANALGSFNVMEAARQAADGAVMLYTSTNKVYGDMAAAKIEAKATRYEFSDEKYRDGITEDFPIAPESPYGCSKYTGESYFSDYFNTYGIKTIVFRCSSMYGTMQKSLEDQAWVSWFVNSILQNKPLTIYGDGKQTRDILYITDVVEAITSAINRIDNTKGQAFNIGGGLSNSISILELIDMVEKETQKKANYKFGEWRLADQRVYISNVEKAKKYFGWYPKISKEEGVRRQTEWETKAVNNS